MSQCLLLIKAFCHTNLHAIAIKLKVRNSSFLWSMIAKQRT